MGVAIGCSNGVDGVGNGVVVGVGCRSRVSEMVNAEITPTGKLLTAIVGCGVGVGEAVAVGTGVDVGTVVAVAVGIDVAEGTGVAVG